MEKINIAELLKDCPKGMELDCLLCDNVVFEKIEFNSDRYPIIINILKTNTTFYLSKYGQFSDEEGYKCVIFPKGKTTWEGFVPPCKFKDGDIVATSNGDYVFLLKKVTSSTANNIYYGRCYFGITLKSELLLEKEDNWYFTRLATENEKQKLFDAIKAQGYRWNAETKTLEELIKPKFKVGDKIVKKDGICGPILITDISDEFYYSNTESSVGSLFISEQDDWELVPNKFDINTLKPFDRVLVRLTNNCVWIPKFFSRYDSEMKCYSFIITDNLGYTQCIPYEGNEHLAGKTDDCDEYYKTWEERA